MKVGQISGVPFANVLSAGVLFLSWLAAKVPIRLPSPFEGDCEAAFGRT